MCMKERFHDIKIEPAWLRFSVTEDLQLFSKVDESTSLQCTRASSYVNKLGYTCAEDCRDSFTV